MDCITEKLTEEQRNKLIDSFKQTYHEMRKYNIDFPSDFEPYYVIEEYACGDGKHICITPYINKEIAEENYEPGITENPEKNDYWYQRDESIVSISDNNDYFPDNDEREKRAIVYRTYASWF